ncbi:MAG: SUMF1/EgtB/PvdO family nonheme iron enzyme [Candidatus Omnitrophica bacterium]|nr:SUMF1/EgtB/PvdO family nonheme iron enzyme [Candidatus Omnitrophota bacterium]
MVGLVLVGQAPSFANNLSVTNVTLGTRDPNAHTVVVNFNVSWQNSWRNKINYDAAWLTVRLIKAQATPPAASLCQITATGLNPAGTSVGNGSNLQMYVPQDAMGAFLQPANPGFIGNINTQNVQLTVNYQNCGFSDTDQIYASVFGLEMVFIPQGSFYAGDYNTSTASLNSGSADSGPWHITSENPLPVTNASSGGYQYVSGGNSGEYATGSSFTIPGAFPKGYNAFYAMKYEINEGQWVQFINSLPASDRLSRDISDNNHKNSTNVVYRNTISCVGTPLVCSTQRPSRAVGYLSWMDVAAFLDWDALRPMTELEFEKMARGPLLPNPGEYIWGNQNAAAAATISGTTEDGTETVVSPANANANYGNTTFTGGDSAQGTGFNQGPLRNGIFATSANATRTSSGASFYGVMDLGGNLKERVVTIGNAAGLGFTGIEGDGVLNTTTGYEGNANTAGWPGMDAGNAANGVDGAAGSGFRGGSWADGVNDLRISDRSEAARTDTAALNTYGGRGVRTYDGV